MGLDNARTKHQSVLCVERLSKRIGERLLWRNISFDLQPGQRLGMAGATGSGKSLLFRTLVLLDPLQEGSIKLLGRTPQAWTLPTYRSHVTYVPQRPVAFPGSVEANFRWPWRLRGHNEANYSHSRVVQWLSLLGKDSSFLSRNAQRLSGGEVQLMAVLRSLQLNPIILLLDEPTASLDGSTAERLEDLLKGWQSEGDRALVVSSHDPAQLERFTHHQLVVAP